MGGLDWFHLEDRARGEYKKRIRAGVRYAREEGERPPEIDIFLGCKRWGVLPGAGGYLDQDYIELLTIENVYTAYKVVDKIENGGLDELTSYEKTIYDEIKERERADGI